MVRPKVTDREIKSVVVSIRLTKSEFKKLATKGTPTEVLYNYVKRITKK